MGLDGCKELEGDRGEESHVLLCERCGESGEKSWFEICEIVRCHISTFHGELM